MTSPLSSWVRTMQDSDRWEVVAAGERFDALHRAMADWTSASWLARALTSLPIDGLRADCADWRARGEQAWAEAAANPKVK